MYEVHRAAGRLIIESPEPLLQVCRSVLWTPSEEALGSLQGHTESGPLLCARCSWAPRMSRFDPLSLPLAQLSCESGTS